ncbi:recombinase family protein [Bradyrhizobium sp. TZ2]
MRERHGFIAYYRVSTARQKSSGLGLEAQQRSVHNYLSGQSVIAEFTEVESGKKNDRPALDRALSRAAMASTPCRREGRSTYEIG